MIEIGLDNLLTSAAPVTQIVGSRIYALTMPEEVEMPVLRYQMIGGQSFPTFSARGLQKRRVQFDCYGQNYAQAVTLRNALICFLDQYQGLLSDRTYVQYVEYIQAEDFMEYQANECRAMAEFYFFYVDPAPL